MEVEVEVSLLDDMRGSDDGFNDPSTIRRIHKRSDLFSKVTPMYAHTPEQDYLLCEQELQVLLLPSLLKFFFNHSCAVFAASI